MHDPFEGCYAKQALCILPTRKQYGRLPVELAKATGAALGSHVVEGAAVSGGQALAAYAGRVKFEKFRSNFRLSGSFALPVALNAAKAHPNSLLSASGVLVDAGLSARVALRLLAASNPVGACAVFALGVISLADWGARTLADRRVRNFARDYDIVLNNLSSFFTRIEQRMIREYDALRTSQFERNEFFDREAIMNKAAQGLRNPDFSDRERAHIRRFYDLGREGFLRRITDHAAQAHEISEFATFLAFRLRHAAEDPGDHRRLGWEDEYDGRVDYAIRAQLLPFFARKMDEWARKFKAEKDHFERQAALAAWLTAHPG